MKVVIKGKQKKSSLFPSVWIGHRSRCVVLFHAEGRGIVLDKGTALMLEDGEYVTSFGMDNFSPLKGEITLSND